MYKIMNEKKKKIFEFLNKQTQPMTSREIAKQDKFNSNTVRRVFGELKREGMLKKVEEGEKNQIYQDITTQSQKGAVRHEAVQGIY
ncbi:hypothetical protein C5S30_06380 [ANME-1 cluster archaeon GoMg4]|nr:hypothetical protein [ANME-1 cluster archaeon GoMg4]